MKIIILGAGQVGGSLAEHLVAERHDVTLVDTNDQRLNEIQDRLDLRVVLGCGSYPDVLMQAGADDADMVIAVTDNDEANMVACQVAYSLYNTPMKIARIRSQHYFINKELFGADHLPIDVFISPEQLVTRYVEQLVLHPGALQVLDFAKGKVKLAVVEPYYGGEMLGKPIGKLYEHFHDKPLRVVAIFRNDHSIAIDEHTVIEIGDEVFFITAADNVDQVTAALRKVEQANKRIMIAGGGNIGSHLAESLQYHYQVKLIEHNRERCYSLAQKIEEAMVLCGDCCDKALLINENIEHVDAFVALTNDDEDNIMSCLQAKRLGAKQVMALITRTAYVDLIEGGPINIAISPQQVTVGSILKHVRRGDVVHVHELRRGAAEAIEVIAHGDVHTSNVVGRSVASINLPKAIIVGAIVRKDNVVIPDQDTIIEQDDHVVLFLADKTYLTIVEKLFQVEANFF